MCILHENIKFALEYYMRGLFYFFVEGEFYSGAVRRTPL
jgi:hypothetical protein